MRININFYPIQNTLTFRKVTILFLLLGLLTASCADDDSQEAPSRNYTMVWNDEFEGEMGEAPDSNKWTYDLGNNDGWGNGEFQVYTDNAENVSLDGEGNLVITAIRIGNSYTSARVKTQGLFAQQYGKFEARLKTPYGPGIWPAFWMLGDNIEEDGWPQCGEIDIMEMKGHQPNIMYGSLHGPGYSSGDAISALYGLENGRFDSEYHTYSVEWGEDFIDFFVDGFWFQSVSPGDLTGDWVYDHPFFLILNVSVGGSFVGFPTDQTPFPQSMIIDYVRVYQEN